MDDSSTGPVIIGLMFILRCLIPLGILFGISYLLQRLGLVTDHAEAEKAEQAEEVRKPASAESKSRKQVTPSKPTSGTHQKRGNRKSATPNKRSRNQ